MAKSRVKRTAKKAAKAYGGRLDKKEKAAVAGAKKSGDARIGRVQKKNAKKLARVRKRNTKRMGRAQRAKKYNVEDAKKNTKGRVVTSDVKRAYRAAGIGVAIGSAGARKAGNSKAGVGAAMYGAKGASKVAGKAKSVRSSVSNKAGKAMFKSSYGARGAKAKRVAGGAIKSAGRHKGRTAVGVAAVGGGAYAARKAYQKRKANTGSTYKRKLKSGKSVTVRKGRRR